MSTQLQVSYPKVSQILWKSIKIVGKWRALIWIQRGPKEFTHLTRKKIFCTINSGFCALYCTVPNLVRDHPIKLQLVFVQSTGEHSIAGVPASLYKGICISQGKKYFAPLTVVFAHCTVPILLEIIQLNYSLCLYNLYVKRNVIPRLMKNTMQYLHIIWKTFLWNKKSEQQLYVWG